MKHRILSVFTLLILTCHGWAGDRDLLDAGDFVEMIIAPTVETKPKKDLPGFERLLDRISIEPSQGSSPSSYIVSGRVVSGNTGAPLERIPVLIGSDGVEPRLAGLTNVDGEFKFRLWIKEDHRDSEIQVSSDFSGFLYVGGSQQILILGPSPSFSNERLRQTDYRRYPLKRLLEISKARKK